MKMNCIEDTKILVSVVLQGNSACSRILQQQNVQVEGRPNVVSQKLLRDCFVVV